MGERPGEAVASGGLRAAGLVNSTVSLLESELHNHPWWIQSEKCALNHMIYFYIMYTQTRLNQSKPPWTDSNQLKLLR